MSRIPSEVAQAAKLIRAEIKKLGYKGRVTSSTYAGGTSIRVAMVDVTREVVEEVRNATSKFKRGKFNGMTDSYEYDNLNPDLPQTSFIFVEVEYTDPLKDAAWEQMISMYPELKPEMSRDEGSNVQIGEEGLEASTVLHRYLHNALSNGRYYFEDII